MLFMIIMPFVKAKSDIPPDTLNIHLDTSDVSIMDSLPTDAPDEVLFDDTDTLVPIATETVREPDFVPVIFTLKSRPSPKTVINTVRTSENVLRPVRRPFEIAYTDRCVKRKCLLDSYAFNYNICFSLPLRGQCFSSFSRLIYDSRTRTQPVLRNHYPYSA